MTETHASRTDTTEALPTAARGDRGGERSSGTSGAASTAGATSTGAAMSTGETTSTPGAASTGAAGAGAAGAGAPDAGAAGSDGTGPSSPVLGRFLARAAVITAGLTAAGALFGLLRDQAIASLFGADAATDAFLIAWTVPELASTLLIEDAMALILVPAFSLALSRRAAHPRDEIGGIGGDGEIGGDGGNSGLPRSGTDAAKADPVRAMVRRTLPKLLLALAATAALLLVTAPWLVELLAPGLRDAETAVDCMRLTSLTVVTFGLAGYFSAALRAHRRFVAPAAIYVAYNAGIIGVMFAGHTLWGVRAAALGVAVGGGLMALLQLPSFLTELRRRRGGEAGPPRTAAASAESERTGAATPARAEGARPAAPETPAVPEPAAVSRHREPAAAPGTAHRQDPPGAADRDPSGAADRDPSAKTPRPAQPTVRERYAGRIALLGTGMLAPVVSYAVGRQAQVLFERYLASPLPAGAISHLNYAQKVAQMPMVLSLMVCTVTFPVVARAMADGDWARARVRVERDLALAGIVVLLGAAYVTACAPQLIELLFQRGAFDAQDTASTASVMRVYSCGLLGHSLVGALSRSYFAGSRPTWYPAGAMAAGLFVTVAAGAVAVRLWGVHGIAAANAAGILTTAVLLLHGLGARRVAVRVGRVSAGLARLVLSAAAAAAAGWAAGRLLADPLAGAAAGSVIVPLVFASVALLVRAPEVPQLFAAVKRRFAHVR